MTVDMLAATFFWPEGTLLGSHHSLPDDAEPEPMPVDGPDSGERVDDFWSAVMRHLWRPSPGLPAAPAP